MAGNVGRDGQEGVQIPRWTLGVLEGEEWVNGMGCGLLRGFKLKPSLKIKTRP